MSHIELDGRDMRLMSIYLMFEDMMPARLAGSLQASLELASIACACSLSKFGCRSCTHPAWSSFSYAALLSSLLVA